LLGLGVSELLAGHDELSSLISMPMLQPARWRSLMAKHRIAQRRPAEYSFNGQAMANYAPKIAVSRAENQYS
jgi:hypothetical protein